MKREEVLEQSRRENRSRDPYEQEVLRQAATNSNVAVIVLAGLFFVVHIAAGTGINWGLYALVMAGNAATFWTKAVRLRRRREAALAALYSKHTLKSVYTDFKASSFAAGSKEAICFF